MKIETFKCDCCGKEFKPGLGHGELKLLYIDPGHPIHEEHGVFPNTKSIRLPELCPECTFKFFDDIEFFIKKEFFIISRVGRDDLQHIGYDISEVDNDTMAELADRLGDDYCEQLFWGSLEIIADILNIPKKRITHEE